MLQENFMHLAPLTLSYSTQVERQGGGHGLSEKLSTQDSVYVRVTSILNLALHHAQPATLSNSQ
jgi:hypothetical protein